MTTNGLGPQGGSLGPGSPDLALEGQDLGFPAPPTVQQIIALVTQHEQDTGPLRDRMEADWGLATLEEFDAGEDYQSYTSQEALIYYKKIISMLATGSIKIRIPVSNKLKTDREKQDGKERFLIGMLRANDERLEDMGQPPLLHTLAAFICLRGWFCGRALFVKDEFTQETYWDITPYDPLQTSWGFGARGLRWICLKSKKTHGEIEEEYGVVLKNRPHRDELGRYATSSTTSGQGIDVYDFLDEFYSTVVVDDEFVKSPTFHGSPRTPGFAGSVDYLPLIQSHNQGKTNNIIHQGESIFEGLRLIMPKLNLVLSAMLQLVALSRNQAFTYTSLDGTKVLEDNPSLEGSQVPLAAGEKIEILPLLEMAKDTAQFLALVTGEIQRLALPYSVYGQLAFQLSGYAVNLLKQATDAPVLPRKQAIERAYRQISGLLSDQFATRSFGESIQLSGRGNNRDWFDEEFGPDMIIGVGAPEITLIVMTPQDELARMQMAIQAAQSHILPLRVIWDEILMRQDTDQLATAIKEERGEQMLPAAQLYSIGTALFDMAGVPPGILEQLGNNRPALEAAGVDLEKFDLAMMYMRAAALADVTGVLSAGGGGGPQASASNPSPENLSSPEAGAPTPVPTDQAGANVPAGSERPGARGPEGG